MDSGEANVENIAVKMRMDFYKLHYPTRKSPNSKHKTNHKMRSNSLITVSQVQPNQDIFTPRGSVRNSITERKNKSNLEPAESKVKQRLNFHTVLSPHLSIKKIEDSLLPCSKMTELEDLAKNNMNVRLTTHKNKDQKVKINRMLMSHKQNQEDKLLCLRDKKEQIQQAIKCDIQEIYEEFFKKDYESQYGKGGQEKFEQKFQYLLKELSKRICHK